MTRTKKRANRLSEGWISAIVLVVFLALWETLSRMDLISHLFFPAPSEIALNIVKLTLSGKLITNLLFTLQRLVLGFLLGAAPALLLGYFMGWMPRIRKVVDPFIAAFHPVPKVAIFPIIMVIFGIGESSKIISIAIAAFFPVLINTMSGVRQLSPVFFEVTKNYGSNTWKTLTRVVIPGSLPTVLSGIRLGLNLAMVIAITVEVLASTKGLGVIIWFAWQTMRIEELYSALVITALLGVVINFILYRLSTIMVPWAGHDPEDQL